MSPIRTMCSLLSGLIILTQARADYTAHVVSSSGQSDISVAPLERFTVDILLESDADNRFNSIVLDLLFSDTGLVYHDYQWQPPFVTGGLGDDSFPKHEDLELALKPTTLSGPATEEGIVDLRLSNLAIDDPQSNPFFASGRLLTLEFSAMESTVGDIVLTPKPIAVGMGLHFIPVSTAGAFTVTVVPEPEVISFMMTGAVLVFMGARKRLFHSDSRQ